MSLFENIGNLPIRLFRKFRFEFRVMTRKGVHDKSPHRLPLEKAVFPYFVNDVEYKRILFVGCSVSTLWYEKIFKTKEYWTIDIDPQKARLGAKHHIIDSLKNLSHYFAEDYFDVIFLNGVIGWGLNDTAETEASIEACYKCLRPLGKIVIGWNDIPERCPFKIDDLLSLKKFRRWEFSPFKTWRFLIEKPSPYYYDFYLKPIIDNN